MREVLFLSSFYRLEKWGAPGLSDLPVVMYQVSERAGIWTQTVCLWNLSELLAMQYHSSDKKLNWHDNVSYSFMIRPLKQKEQHLSHIY